MLSCYLSIATLWTWQTLKDKLLTDIFLHSLEMLQNFGSVPAEYTSLPAGGLFLPWP